MQRIALVFTPFVSLLAAGGIKWLLDDIAAEQALPVLLVVCLFTAVGPLMATEDVVTYPGESASMQASISESEYEQLESTSAFIDGHFSGDGDEVSTLQVMRQMLGTFGIQADSDILVKGSELRSPDTVLYNENWPRSRLRYGGETAYLRYIIMSNAWLDGHINRGSKVYTGGTISLVRHRDHR
jgi:hypothetical protein